MFGGDKRKKKRKFLSTQEYERKASERGGAESCPRPRGLEELEFASSTYCREILVGGQNRARRDICGRIPGGGGGKGNGKKVFLLHGQRLGYMRCHINQTRGLNHIFFCKNWFGTKKTGGTSDLRWGCWPGSRTGPLRPLLHSDGGGGRERWGAGRKNVCVVGSAF